MKSRQDGEAIISERKLANATVTERVDGVRGARRSIRFNNPNGLGVIEIEIDADPSPEQLADLERNLPRRPEPAKEKPVDGPDPLIDSRG